MSDLAARERLLALKVENSHITDVWVRSPKFYVTTIMFRASYR
jgi:hypothetical protein